jgi:hypothetical protein
MRRLSAPYAVFAVFLVAGIALPTVTAAVSAAPIQGAPTAVTAGITAVSSTNWAGYGAIGANRTVTMVSGSWIEPTVSSCGSALSAAAFWVGIDGMVSYAPSVEQVGTIAECYSGAVYYYAWWEIYPLNSIQPISKITLSPGDHVTASVTYSSTTKEFAMKIRDITTGVTFTKDKAYGAAHRATAECIAERPSTSSGLVPLPDFGKVTFSSCTATIAGTTGGIGSFASVWEITMASSVHNLAVPSALTSSTKFSVTWKHSS